MRYICGVEFITPFLNLKMNTHYHPKHGVKYMSDYVKITVEKPGKEVGTTETVPISTENDLPLCKEVVRTLYLPFKTKDGLTDCIPIDKDHLVELLAYARSIEEREPVYAKPDLTREDIQATLVNLQQARWINDPVEANNTHDRSAPF